MKEERLAGMLERIDVVAKEAGRLPFGQEFPDRSDGGVDPGAPAVGAEEEPRQLVPLCEEIELAAEEPTEAFDSGEPNEGDAGQCRRQLRSGRIERCLIELGLGREVIVEQLLVDSRSAGDGLGAGAREAVACELVARGGEQEVGGRRLAAGQ